VQLDRILKENLTPSFVPQAIPRIMRMNETTKAFILLPQPVQIFLLPKKEFHPKAWQKVQTVFKTGKGKEQHLGKRKFTGRKQCQIC
jgi:hypothetical protein